MASQDHSEVFSVRIVSLDYYMSPPIPDLDYYYSSFQGTKVEQVPVIRIFGATPAGQKTCLHIHRALPYFYVPLPEELLRSPQEGHVFIHTLLSAIEKAFKHKPASKRQHVHDYTLVRAKSFYGFHTSEEVFLKIILYHPHDVPRAASLLLDGSVFGRSFQPFESHIPYLLQFLVDYSLYGMSHLHSSKVKFRSPLIYCPTDAAIRPSTSEMPLAPSSYNSEKPKIWVSSTVRSDLLWPDSTTALLDSTENNYIHLTRRQSICQLEADARVEDIINEKFKINSSLSQTSCEVRMVQSLAPIWEEEYERSGLQDSFKQVDPEKPYPDNVLRSFMTGLDYDNTLSSFCIKACNLFPSRFHPLEGDDTLASYMNSVCGISRKDELVRDQQEDNFCDVSCLGAEENKETLSSRSFKEGNKCVETEALGLLSWLASSQAEEDLDAGDELLQEAILSPLLPGKPYSEALEIAHRGYEIASQLECQEILESVEVLKSERSKQHASFSSQKPFFNSIEGILKSEDSKEFSLPSSLNLLDNVSSASVIRQSDGSFDESLGTQNGNTSEANMSYGGEIASGQSSGITPMVSCKDKGNKLLGTLPFSVNKCLREAYESLSPSSSPGDEMVNGGSHNPQLCNKKGYYYDSLKNEIGVENCREKLGKTLGLCSVRDLMRKKRCIRVKQAETQVQKKEGITPGHAEEHTPTASERESHIFSVEEPSIGQSLTHQNVLGNVACSTNLPSSFRGTKCFDLDSVGCQNPSVQKLNTGLKSSVGLQSSIGLQSSADLLSSVNLQSNTGASNNFGVNQGSMIIEKKIFKAPLNLAAGGFHVHETDSKKLLDDSVVEPAGAVSCSFFSGVCRNERSGSSANIMKCHSFNHRKNFVDEDELNSVINKDVTSVYITEKYASNPDRSIAQGVLLPEMHVGCYQPSICVFDGNSSIFCKETASEGLFEMTFINKPPSNEQIHYPDVSSAAAQTDGNIDNQQGMKNIIPFFLRGSQDENLHNHNVIFSRNLALGIPTHFQNDGSVLYLLTHALSSPTLSTVYSYLSEGNQHDAGRVRCSQNSHLTDADPSMYDSLKSEEQCSLKTGNFHSNVDYVSSEPRLGSIPLKVNVSTDDLHDLSQISGPEKFANSIPTPLSQIGFRDPASVGHGQQLTLISMELLAESRGDLRPDPKFDAINALSLVVQEDTSNACQIYVLLRVITEKTDDVKNDNSVFDCKLILFTDEKLLLEHFVEIVSYLDPDILMGWEIQRSSLGYLAERAFHLEMNLLQKISRTPLCEKRDNTKESRCSEFSDVIPEVTDAGAMFENLIIDDDWGRTHASGLHVGGRIVLNIWRLMRAELKLNMYSAEAVAEAVLRQKIPLFSDRVLNQWYSSGIGRARHKCIEYVIARSMLTIQIMSQLDMINRTSELARVFGIDFFSVISRGSQYRVESMLLRLAHTQNYLAISPGHQQVALQPAMECLPLVMEPESGFYADPVVVLDFQSLYPSMIIAYNLCFCTCLGKVIPSKKNVLGVSSYYPDVQILNDCGKKLRLTPNRVIYAPPEVRIGVLPRLLEEILSTRIMVKQTMKKLTSSQLILRRKLEARQLALKLIANVTYGYTAASFSGRMPCAEIADSIVQCGRRTLEAAISYVNQHEKWNAKVIYGDTDSMFVLLRGRSKEDAFMVGNEIAAAVTRMNPEPVTLRMEKVYHPCFLLTKKRYVGYSYENLRQEKPIFDAKGIDTVRRDTCPAVAKILERSIRLYFESRDLSMVKSYLKRQWTRLLSGKVSLQDFIFAKEVRLGSYRTSSLPPAAIVARKAMEIDPRAEPHYGERVPYVVVHGEPGSRLIDMVVHPFELLDLNSSFRPNDLYYINKQIIPALQRVFGLLRADINLWFSAIPRPARPLLAKRFPHTSHSHSFHVDYNNHNNNPQPKKSRIDRYYSSKHCPLCGDLIQSSNSFCMKCSKKESLLVAALVGRTSGTEREMQHLAEICRHCGGGDWAVESGVKCTSLACSVLYERRKVQRELESLSSFATAAGFYPPCNVDWF